MFCGLLTWMECLIVFCFEIYKARTTARKLRQGLICLLQVNSIAAECKSKQLRRHKNL